MIAILLAGGYAKRLGPLTMNTPKPLLVVASKPILAYVIDLLVALGPIIRQTIVLANRGFAPAFCERAQYHGAQGIEVVSGGFFTEEENSGPTLESLRTRR